ncbi:hypothetical protein BPUM_2094 [Bacillus pumilus SAFR-032]|uniref:Uncharacterized protein n=1 Tax=Bacillus pumilus (strain SAFR-032) TaxID=315750 RepID=A8FEU6_BACP2|nr:hypothetical protein BPUM_2094 [Bacillus pumilus SAFR-032]
MIIVLFYCVSLLLPLSVSSVLFPEQESRHSPNMWYDRHKKNLGKEEAAR